MPLPLLDASMLEVPVALPERPPVRDEREPEDEPDDVDPPLPAISISRLELSDSMLSRQPLTWSLRLLSWSLIWLRRDQRKTPAPTAAAAAAAVATGRSRAVSIQPLLY
jgi:hypothetical protein